MTKDVFQVESEQTNLKNRSKSELDLSIKSTSTSKSNKSKENITKNTSMFAFFTRKKIVTLSNHERRSMSYRTMNTLRTATALAKFHQIQQNPLQ